MFWDSRTLQNLATEAVFQDEETVLAWWRQLSQQKGTIAYGGDVVMQVAIKEALRATQHTI